MQTSFQRKKKTKKITLLTNSNLIENGPSQKFIQVQNRILLLKGAPELISVSKDDSDRKPALHTTAKHRKGFWGRKVRKKRDFLINCDNIISVLINGVSCLYNNILTPNE